MSSFKKNSSKENRSLIIVFFSLLLITSCNELDPGEFSILGIQDAQVSNNENVIAFNVRLSEASDHKVKVNFSTLDQSAKAGEHYSDTSGTLVFKPGDTEQLVQVDLLGATFNSPHRKFRVKLENPAGADIHNRRKQATGSILNSGTELIIHDAEATVKDDTIRFKVSYYGSADEQASVNYSTSEQSAKAGKHFVETSGTLIFDPGQKEKYIPVKLLHTSFNAPHRKFRVRLDNPVKAKLHNRDRQATGMIHNDAEHQTELSISDSEAQSDEDKIRFTVKLSKAADEEVSVDFSTSDQSAKAGKDYIEESGTLTFEPGDVEQQIDLALIGAPFNSPHRKFRVRLDNPIGAKLRNRDRQATGMIHNNSEHQIKLSISDSEVQSDEDNIRFTVNLSKADDEEVSVDFSTSDRSAKAGMDYEEKSGTIVFAPGETVQTINVKLLNSSIKGMFKKFSVSLSDPSGIELDKKQKRATGTILGN